jgi:hypothetical protein
LITLEEYREKVEDIKLELKETIDESRVEEWYRLKSLPC